jgi:hypothetical protein
MPEVLVDLPEDLDDGDSLADWAEAVCILEERESISRTELKRRLGDVGDADVAIALLAEQIGSRAFRAPSSYPFARTDAGIGRNGAVSGIVYEFLLWASWAQAPVRLGKDYRAIDRLFDRIVLKAVCAYLGPRTRGVRFGTPASDDRPNGFADALVWLGDLMDIEATGALPPNDNKKDAGVDVIAWLPFAERRSDFVTAIAQCTFRSDWEVKAAETFAAAALWGGGWLATGMLPLTFLAVPFCAQATDLRFPELRQLVNVILDRVRLCELVAHPYEDDVADLTAWISSQRDGMRLPAAAPEGSVPKD